MRLSILLSTSLLIFSGSAPLRAEASDPASEAIVNKFLDASKAQQENMRGAQMEVRIAASLPRLAKEGELKPLRSISRVGMITYRALGFSGDGTVKREVISRFLTAESQPRDTAITPANYNFKYKGAGERDGRTVEIVLVSPKRKAEGLFKGELWLDPATGMPVRESGRLVKSGSIFLKKVEFVNSFEIQDGVAIPKHFESTVDTRLVGRAVLSVDYSNFSRQETAEDEAALTAAKEILRPWQ